MFGRVVVNKSELKFREFDTYRSYYCGLCRALKDEGLLCSLSLNFDMTFLAILLNSLYESKIIENKCRCICHMCKKHDETKDSFSPYLAHMTILLSYYKCIDDFKDDKNIIKYIYSLYLKPKFKKTSRLYPEKAESIKKHLNDLSKIETGNNFEECANLFGHITAVIFTPKDDIWQDILYRMGFFLGKFIYLADAYEDLEEDIKKNRPNPLKEMSNMDDFDKEMKIILNMLAAECAREFDSLPLERNTEILKNIIYAGIWSKLEGVRYE